MSGGEIAALIAAAAFVLLVGLLAVPILRLGRTLDEATKLVAGMSQRALPIFDDATVTVRRVNGQLERVDTITAHAESVTTNVSALTSLFAATLGSPVVKVAAFTYGVRKAAASRRKRAVTHRVADEIKAERRENRRGRRSR